MSRFSPPWSPYVIAWLGVGVFLAGAFVLPSYHGGRFYVGYTLSLLGYWMIGRAGGRQKEISRAAKTLGPMRDVLRRLEAAQQAAERYAAARARGPQ